METLHEGNMLPQRVAIVCFNSSGTRTLTHRSSHEPRTPVVQMNDIKTYCTTLVGFSLGVARAENRANTRCSGPTPALAAASALSECTVQQDKNLDCTQYSNCINGEGKICMLPYF